MENTLRAKNNRKISTVLAGEEIAKVFEHLAAINLLIAKIFYGSGLRLMHDSPNESTTASCFI